MPFGIDPSALNGASLRLAVIGNNITNSGVTGFKGSDFSDVLAGASYGQSGNRIAGSRQLFTQGTINTSNNPLDMAINGNGFYVLKRSDGTVGYTRDGSFNLDKNGYVVNPTGDQLEGYKVDASNNIAVGDVAPIQVDTKNSPPQPTSSVGINLVLNSVISSTQPAIPVSTAFDPNNASTYTSTTISTIYDSEGASHDLQTYYVNRSGTTVTNSAASTDASQLLTSGTDASALYSTLYSASISPSATALSVYTAMKDKINALSGSVTATTKKDLLNGLNTVYAAQGTIATGASFAQSLAGAAVTSTGAFTSSGLSGGILANLTLPQNTWDVYATMSGNSITGNSGSTSTLVTFGTPSGNTTAAQEPTSFRLYFDSTGALTSPTTPINQVNFQIPSSQTISQGGTVPDGTLLPGSIKLDLTSARQISADFLASTTQDGFPAGQFQSLSTDASGILYAHYSSGATRKVGEVVLATFAAQTALAQDRNNQFTETYASGAPIINVPGKGGAGQIVGSSVEAAGVDLTSEMIRLISAQRTYQANSEVVKREDQILQTIIGIGQ